MVEVTQEDREAAASIAVLVEMRELIREGRADHHAEPFARHRIAAENAALERAAKVADDHRVRAWDIAEMQGQNALVGSGRNHAGREIASEIRALKGPSNG